MTQSLQDDADVIDLTQSPHPNNEPMLQEDTFMASASQAVSKLSDADIAFNRVEEQQEQGRGDDCTAFEFSRKRKTQEDEQPRKREAWSGPPTSPTLEHAYTLATISTSTLQNDTQNNNDNEHGQSGSVAYAPAEEDEEKDGRKEPEEWCARKRFPDGDWVTREKFISYAKELTAREAYHDEKNPRFSIRPLFVKSPDGSETRRASRNTVEYNLTAIRALYKDQCLVDGIIPNLIDNLGKKEVDALLCEYERTLKDGSRRIDADGEDDNNNDNEDASDTEEENEDEVEVEDNESVNEDEEENSNDEESGRDGNDDHEDFTANRASVSNGKKKYVEEQRQPKASTWKTSQGKDQERGKYVKSATENESGGGRKHVELYPVNQTRFEHFIFSGTTQRHHLPQLLHWKRYSNGDKVTGVKVLAYVKELTAREEYHDENNPHLCIKPLFVNVRKGGGGEVRRASLGTVRSYLSSIRALYRDQCVQTKIAPNMSRDLAKVEVDLILEEYQSFIKDPPLQRTVSPGGEQQASETQEGEQQDDAQSDEEQAEKQQDDAQEVDELQADEHQEVVQDSDAIVEPPMVRFKKSMKALWAPKAKYSSRHSWTIAHRDRFRLSFSYFEPDYRKTISTLVPTQLYPLLVMSQDNDGVFASGIAVAKNFKMAYWNPERYSIFLREEDVQMCPVGALAFYLLAKWTEKKSVPEFLEQDWMTDPLVLELEGGSSSNSLITDISDSNVDERSYSSFFDHNLTVWKPTEYSKPLPYMLATTLSQKSVFELPRNRVLPSVELQRQLFPFIEELFPDNDDWRIWLDNVMLNRPEDTNRPDEEQANYTRASYTAIRLMLLLAGFRKVILQDFAAMLISGDNDGRGGSGRGKHMGFDHVLAIKHPVLSSPAFQEFASQLHSAMGVGSASTYRIPIRSNTVANDESVRHLQIQDGNSSTAPTTHYVLEENDNYDFFVDATIDHNNQLRHAISTPEPPSTFDAARTPTVPMVQGRLSNDDLRLQHMIQELNARVVSLEQEKKEMSERNHHQSQYGYPTPESASFTNIHFPVESTSQNKDNSRNNYDSDRLWQENQDLREKVAALEQENKKLSGRHSPLQQFHAVERTGSNLATASSSSHAVPRVIPGGISNRNDESVSLRQEVRDLRGQLVSTEQAGQEAVEYAAAAIETVEFLDNKVNQIESSMHGLWTMIAKNEAAKFVAAPGLLPMGPPAAAAAAAGAVSTLYPATAQTQQQDQYYRARLRVDTLRNKIATANGKRRS
ncbi:hypothetical protein BGX23_009446 [Mortierella sp. AD031]|nr:hypothetical protein BGX23_009446 [Mortierella sp. AD031]